MVTNETLAAVAGALGKLLAAMADDAAAQSAYADQLAAAQRAQLLAGQELERRLRRDRKRSKRAKALAEQLMGCSPNLTKCATWNGVMPITHVPQGATVTEHIDDASNTVDIVVHVPGVAVSVIGKKLARSVCQALLRHDEAQEGQE